jgi:3-methyladenine DNA glycosylase AlkC
MATATVATSRVEIGAMVMNQPKQLRPDLQEVVADILALKAMEKNERFITHKAQREILNKLNASDLASVARAIAEADAKQQPIFARTTNK